MRPYVPRWVLRFGSAHDGAGYRVVPGTLLSADVSGFTKLSEELAALGKEGAEELTARINGVFSQMIERAERFGGDVLKFGGDALLILFEGNGHERRAVAAAAAMRSTLARPVRTRNGRRIQLRVSTGVHAGSFQLHLVHTGHHELLVVGPDASTTVRCEAEAGADRIVASAATLGALPDGWIVEPSGLGAYVEPTVDDLVWVGDEAEDTQVDAEAFVPPGIVPLIHADVTGGGHRGVTVGFLAFAGIDDLTVAVGPQEVHARLDRLGALVGDAAERHGAHVLASDIYPDGGKFIITAGAPTSAGNDEAAVLSTLHAVLSRFDALPIRAGVNSGHVFVGDVGGRTRRTFTIMGDAVNLAARLMQKAGVGELIASRACLDRAAVSVRAHDLEPFLVKGKSEPIEAARVDSILGTRVRGPGSDVAMVGRERTVAELVDTLAHPRIGQAVVVNVVGPSGVGKTRLADEVRRGLPDLRHVVIEGATAGATVPYEPLRRLLRGLLDVDAELPPTETGAVLEEWVHDRAPSLAAWIPLLAIPVEAVVEPTEEVDRVPRNLRRNRLHQVLLELFDELLDGPALVVLDDLHAFDDASRKFARDLVAGTVDRAWSALCTREPDDDPFDDYLNALARHVTLTPLDQDASRRLVSLALGDVPVFEQHMQRILQRADGNPLLLIEYARAAAKAGSSDELPGSLEALVTSQLDRLEPRDRSLLQVASVVGDTVDVDLLEEIDDSARVDVRDPMVWGRLQDFVTRVGPTSFAFRQSLHRRVAYETLSFAQRRTLHSRTAAVLSRDVTEWTQERAARVSEHHDLAEEHRRAYELAITAAEQARDGNAAYEATLLYQRALSNAEHLRDVDPRELAAHAEAFGDVAEVAGRFDVADEAYQRAMKHRAAEPIRLATLMRKRGNIRERQGRYVPALRWLTRGLSLLEELPEDDLTALGVRAEIENAYCGVRFRQGKYRDCITRGLRAIEVAERACRPDIVAHAHYILDSAHTHLRIGNDEWPRGMALRTYEELDDQVGLASTLNNLGVWAHTQGEWDLSLRLYRRAREARDRIQDTVNAALHTGNIAEVISDQGHYEDAEALLTEVLRTCRASRFTVGVYYYTAVLARTVGRRGDLERARALFTEAIDGMREMGAAGHAVEFEGWLALCLERGRATDEAAAIAERLCGGEDDPVLRAQMLRVRGIAAARGGDFDAAVRLFQEGLTVARGASARFEVALALEALSRVVEDSDEAGFLGRQAGAALEFLGVVRTDGEALPPPRPRSRVAEDARGGDACPGA